MSSEQEAALSGLQTAIRMEIDGKEFYHKSSQASVNERGAKLFKTLAAEETVHERVFTEIFNKLKTKQQWPDTKIPAHNIKKLHTVFREAIENLGAGHTAVKAEIDAVQTGMDMENKTLDYYRERSAKAAFPAEKQLYDSFAGQESEHFQLLQDYYEFLDNPAAYFVKKEHSSVDGG
jgi:rubrerythrin